MEKLVEYIVKELVDNKDAVKVTTVKEEDVNVIHVTVDPEELGRVVGKSGRNAQAIRTLVSSLVGKSGLNDGKYIVKFE